ncbi:AMP-binding protein [Corynebacterium bovis]|uniref:AMP-binding protein n=1 Tax=Corynebacterium bovis TaxID=36808 RepID=UPI001E28B0A0|nr:AMP-binding protein [Corynebacterium bovis]
MTTAPTTRLLPLPLSTGTVPDAVPVLSSFLAGDAAVLPLPDGPGAAARTRATLTALMRPDEPAAPGTLIACTSGSTGTPKGAVLRTPALDASARATAELVADRWGVSPGPWLLALPPHHIAGLQVVLRSLHAGFTPHVTDPDLDGFTAATRALRAAHPGEDLHTSLVPTQLVRILRDPAATAALREYASVLVGGAATPPDVLARCRDAGVHILLTYGSSETSGGMVYDGRPLPGTSVTLEDPDAAGVGRVLLHGPTVAEGYRNVPAGADGTDGTAGPDDAFPRPGTFRTSDLGRIDDGVLTVLGRADGAVNTGDSRSCRRRSRPPSPPPCPGRRRARSGCRTRSGGRRSSPSSPPRPGPGSGCPGSTTTPPRPRPPRPGQPPTPPAPPTPPTPPPPSTSPPASARSSTAPPPPPTSSPAACGACPPCRSRAPARSTASRSGGPSRPSSTGADRRAAPAPHPPGSAPVQLTAPPRHGRPGPGPAAAGAWGCSRRHPCPARHRPPPGLE